MELQMNLPQASSVYNMLVLLRTLGVTSSTTHAEAFFILLTSSKVLVVDDLNIRSPMEDY